MNWIVQFAKTSPTRRWPVLFLGLLLSACGRNDTQSYRVPKESPATAAAGLPAGHPDISADASGTTPAAAPQLSWTLPVGWQEVGAGKMSLATFNIPGTDGKQAQITVTPLRGLAGKEVLIVNMWRQQVGQSELSAEEVTQQLQPVEIGGEPGKMFEIAGKADGTGSPVRIVTAMQHHADTSWFYKLQGDDELVTAQKPNFVVFLRSVKIEEAAAPAALPDGHPPIAKTTATTPAAPVPAPTEAVPAAASRWNTPADWKSVPPGAMQVAKFSVPEAGGAKADVTISVFPNSTGGTLANVNRWRNQIGLAPVDEPGLAPIVKPLDEKIPDALIADLSNGSRRLVGAIVPGGGQWHFFKLLGDDTAVARQKDAFIKFVKEVKY